MRSETSQSIPEQIAKNLRDELDKIYDVHLNLSNFKLLEFYEFYKDTVVTNTTNNSERILIYNENFSNFLGYRKYGRSDGKNVLSTKSLPAQLQKVSKF